jgi:hypothetical protein
MSTIITQQDADASIEAGHGETAARSAAITAAENNRRADYREQMRQAVAQQGAPSRPSTPGEGIRTTPETARHVAALAAAHEKANILTPFETMEISNNARHGLMRTYLAAGKPLPTDHELASVQRAAVDASRSAKLAK